MYPELASSPGRPSFPAYLLPSFSFPRPSSFRRRQSSSTSVGSFRSTTTSMTILSTLNTPLSSANTTPSSSPLEPSYFYQRPLLTQANELLLEQLEEETETKINTAAKSRNMLTRFQPETLKCSTCATDIAFTEQIVSKGFTGRHGRAYLVSATPQPYKVSAKRSQPENEEGKERSLLNTKVGRPVNRQLVTGNHVVADISCMICSAVLGWKYVDAKEPAQKYKIGKFILETRRVVGGRSWEERGENDAEDISKRVNGINEDDNDSIVFDSDDEEDCEDLFAGTWDRDVVAKRRSKRVDTRKKMDVEV